MGTLQNKMAWRKTAVEISGISFADDRVIEVIVKDTGKRAKIRRDMAEFEHHRVFIPLWLAEKINPKLHHSNGPG